MKRTLKKVFFKAKTLVANDIIQRFCKLQDVWTGERPHYKDFCTNLLNQRYNLNLINVKTEDTLWSNNRKTAIGNALLEFIEGYDIHESIYQKACRLFYDEFKEDRTLYNEGICVFADQYISTNNLKERVGDRSSFLSEYVMTGEYSDVPRFVALQEIINYCGFATEEQEYIPLLEYTSEMIHDIKLKCEIEELNDTMKTYLDRNKSIHQILSMIIQTKKTYLDRNESIHQILSMIIQTKNYGILQNDVIRKIIDTNEYDVLFFEVAVGSPPVQGFGVAQCLIVTGSLR